MKDTALFNKGDGCLQVLCHTEIQHDAGQSSPAGATQVIGNTETKLVVYDHNQVVRVEECVCEISYLQNDEAVTFSVRDRFCLVGMSPILYLMWT